LINIIIALLIVGLDQYTKYLASTYLQGHSISVIQGFFELNYVRNDGAAFGIMQGSQMIFLILTPLILMFLILYFVKNKAKIPSYIIPLILIISGALGNYLDRIRLGYVIDFLDFKIWPVFNLADTFVVIGGLLLTFLFIKEDKDARERED